MLSAVHVASAGLSDRTGGNGSGGAQTPTPSARDTAAAVVHIERHADPIARIRTLVNLMKTTGGKYVELGRNVSLDETSVACRSKFGRNLIMFNPMKPGGKYHFRIYMLCCATSWIAIDFRVHCDSEVKDRQEELIALSEIQDLRADLTDLAVVRGQVIEVVRPLYYSNRVINADNYYMSVQLLAALRVRGLCGRGAARVNSVHFPKHVVVKKKECSRGTFRRGVSADHEMVAVSWFDSAVAKMVSNADGFNTTSLTHRIGNQMQPFTAPACVAQYNAHMQGVDRFDQLRTRFSLADGHSFKKWYKKFGMALVDVARVNAYMTRRQVVDMSKERDPHRVFVEALADELLSDIPSVNTSEGWSVGVQAADTAVSPQKQCIAVPSKQLFPDGRKRRQCTVCRWENRPETVVTDQCTLHNVCLRQTLNTPEPKPYFCQQAQWTCWEKFHKFYLPRQLFYVKGNMMKSSDLHKMKLEDLPPPRPTKKSRAARSIL